MYDRKTWFVLAICIGLLGLNFHYSAKNQQAEAERREKERKAEKQSDNYLDDATGKPTAGLTVDVPPPATETELIELSNDKVTFTLTNIGGGITHAEFKDEFEVGSKTEKVRSNRHGRGPIGGIADPAQQLINIPYTYKEEQSIPGKKAVYIAQLSNGLVAKKTFSLIEGDKPGTPYLLDYKLQLENAGQGSLSLGDWSIFLGEASPLYPKENLAQTGFFWREDGDMNFKHSGKLRKKRIINSPEDQVVRFAGVTNQFFTTVIKPKENTDSVAVTSVWGKSRQIEIFEGEKPSRSVRAGIRLPSKQLQPGESTSYEYRVFIGPKHNTMLRKMEKDWGEGWGDVMQYGFFSWISRILNSLLNTYHNLIDGISKSWSWGLAIILLTITVRIVIWPLHAKSTRTMKRMSKLKPEMDKLREKYKEDPNKLNMETMGLYRKYGINPLGGCLPMLLQIPIFFGFFTMLRYAVELRAQGFLWLEDLSQPDTLFTIGLPFGLPFIGDEIPFNILPIVMAVTSFLQIKMTPSTGDKMQRRILMLMPIMFFLFCYNFASALALYWTTQNIFSIGQTWLMGKMPEPELKAGKNAGKKSWMQRMAEQAEAQKRAQQQGRGRPGQMRDVTPKKKNRGPRTGG